MRVSSAAVLLVTITGLLAWAADTTKPDRPERKAPTGEIRPRDMADSMHLVIAADRQAYAQHVAQRWQERRAEGNAGHGAKDLAIPAPCELLRLSTVAIQTQGAEFHYSLRSLTPLEPRNAPETDIEKVGLNFVAHHPDQNYYSQETLGGRRYLTAVYPERATVAACATCHNEHPASPKKDFKVGDVMGGLVIRIALEF